MAKLRVAVLDMQPIEPATGGGRLRLLGLYSGFKNEIDVTYVGSYDWRGPGYRDHKLSECLREIDVPFSEEHFQAHDTLSAELGKGCIDTAFPMQGHLSEAFILKAQEEAKKAEVVIFSHQWLFPFVVPVIDGSKQLIVYDSHNCEGLLRVKLLDDGTALADKICREAVRCEYDLCHAADLILACSQEDKNSFISLYGVAPDKIIIVPNGVFTSQITPCEAEKKAHLRKKLDLTKPTACFIGSNYYPNEEAARLIIKVADSLKQYQFVIIGGVGESLKDINLLEHPNLIVTGFVDEQEKLDYLAASDIAVNPMLSGSGTNIKMFDFMAAGLPIITTEIGARGIENTNGRIYLKCDKNNLGNQIERLVQNPDLRENLKLFGRREAEERYSWEQISFKLGNMLEIEYKKKATAIEKVLMISSYPPEKCGIGTYAEQQVRYLREHGSMVDVWAIKGNGKYREELNAPERILQLKEMKNRYDRIIIQYHASFFYFGNFMERMKIHQAFKEVFQENSNIEIIAHEVSYPLDRESSALQKQRDILEQNAKREKWLSAGKIVFHTLRERTEFCTKLNIQLNEEKMPIVAPNYYFTKNADCSQEEARERLKLPLDKKIYLCIGFIQPHKAFDKVAEVFTEILDESKQLYIVGSLRLVYDETLEYLQLLETYETKSNNIFLKSSFVSDEIFDMWLIACDVIIIPYKEIWSSGVLGRAKLFEKPCIVHNVGGLSEQLNNADKLFESYEELAELLND